MGSWREIKVRSSRFRGHVAAKDQAHALVAVGAEQDTGKRLTSSERGRPIRTAEKLLTAPPEPDSIAAGFELRRRRAARELEQLAH